MKGKLFAISGPSGVGKNSVLNRVMQLRDRVQLKCYTECNPFVSRIASVIYSLSLSSCT